MPSSTFVGFPAASFCSNFSVLSPKSGTCCLHGMWKRVGASANLPLLCLAQSTPLPCFIPLSFLKYSASLISATDTMASSEWQLNLLVALLLSRQLVLAVASLHSHPRSLQTDADRGLLSDTQGLLSFKQLIEEDPLGILNGWDLQASSNSCDWFGITCANARVIALDLSGYGLVAPLPTAALAPLDQLQEIRLASNAFYGYGADQAASSACNTLTVLDLSSNQLNGSFSDLFLQNCKTLTYLNVSHNNFLGLLPSSTILGDASSIIWLDLSHNNFLGMLSPDIFKHCGSLSWLDFSSNSISGTLPVGISQCASLRHLDLSFNLLDGSLPADIFPLSAPSTTSNLTSLQLSSNKLSGNIPNIASCANAVLLDLSNNGFTGELPSSLGACTHLRLLNLSYNALTGNLPSFLASLGSLEVLSLAQNHFTGMIPPEMGHSLLALQELDLSGNKLVGTVPSSFTNFTSLYSLNLGDNVFSGGFPEEVVGRMTSVRTLIMSFNNLTGTLPAFLSNTSSLYLLDLSANAFTGHIPGTICGVTLQRLLLADNELSGAVPLGSCSGLVALDVSCNFISSTFPKPLPVLANLQGLVMWGNLIAEEIPSDICDAASQLKLLILNVNLIHGSLPPTLANCSSLEWLSLANNLLTGSIPPELGLMPRINYLHLNNNSLSGEIPPALGDCKFLVWLDLSSNQLEGIIPPELAKQSGKVIKGTLDITMHISFFKYLQGDPCTRHGLGSVLMMGGIRPERLYKIPNFRTCEHTRLYADIAPYYFPGPPGSVQGGSLTYLDLAYNKLSGTIPAELGTMTSATVLSLSGNHLTGDIPSSLANLIQCSILFLDHNDLQGPIPPGLSNLGFLSQFDLSSNNLSGSIPDTSKLSTFPASVFANNIYLCGPPLPSCYPQATASNKEPLQGDASTSSGSSGQWAGYSIAVAAVGTFIFLVISVCGLVHCVVSNHNYMKERLMRSSYASSSQPCSSSDSWLSSSGDPRSSLSLNMTMFEKPLRKLNYHHLWEATKGFSAEVIIGRGGFGDVYKATLGDGTIVAVKKLIHTVDQGEREFIAEMETIGKIKHRNLVPLLGFCRLAEERLLVYEFMEEGSLDKWLHGNIRHHGMDGRPLEANDSECEHMSKSLSWESRKKIALGTARGMCFLHNSCIPHIIHRDLKSANVLLDEKLEARVSDFGMARLVSAAETHLSVSAVVGTPGYVPPEYGQSFRCTKQGDVYSFGVILLELITGRRPTWLTVSSSDTGATDSDSGKNNVATPAIMQLEESAIDLVGWVKRHVREGKAAEVLDMGALQGCSDTFIATADIESREREMLAYLSIACRCVQERPFTRPTMANIMVGFRELQRGQDGDE